VTGSRKRSKAITEPLEAIPARAWVVLFVCSASMFLLLMDSAAMFVGFPFIEERFSATTSRTTLSWIVTALFIFMVSSLLIAGRAADRFGRRKVFLMGLGLYGIAGIAGGCIPVVWVLITTRSLQGVAIAMLSPSGLAMSLKEFPPSRRAYAFGVWGTIGAVAGLCGSPLAAGMVEFFNWQAIFIFTGIFSLAILVAGLVTLSDEQEFGDQTPIDFVSAILATISVAGLTLFLVQGQEWGFTSAKTITCLFAFLITLPVFVHRNRTQTHPLFPQTIFSQRSFTIGCVASALSQVSFFSIFFGLPLYMREVWEWSPLRIGFALIPMNIVPLLTAAIAGKIVDQRGPRSMVIFGGVWSGTCFLMMGFFLMDPGYTYLASGLLVSGLGLMAIGNNTTIATLIDIDDALLASASSASYTARRLGSALGAVLTASIVGNRVGDDFKDVYIWVWILGAAAYFIGSILTYLFYPKRPSEI
jgi:EmrB/QacA subfamily drug resistance transporter